MAKNVPGRRLVLLSLTGSGIVIIASKATSGEFPGPRILLGLASIYVILGFVADFAPQIAGPLAILVLIAILLNDGGRAFEGTSKALGREKATERNNKRFTANGKAMPNIVATPKGGKR